MKEELSYQERKKWAEYLYKRTDIPVRDIALEVQVDEAELSSWIRAGNWLGSKRSLLTSKAAQLDQLYALLEKLHQKILTDAADGPNVKDVDLYIKYTTAIKNLEVQTTVSEFIEAFELFLRWLRKRDLALAQKIAPYFDAFIKEKLAE